MSHVVDLDYTEHWKPIVGFSSLYEISNQGRVKSLAKYGRPERILKPTLFRSPGYYFVSLAKEKRYPKRSIHRLLMEAFVPNPDNLPQINHINGNKLDNSLSNLEWCTARHNTSHAYKTRLNKSHEILNDEQLRKVLRMRGRISAPKLAESLPIKAHSIYKIWGDKSYLHARRAL